MRRCLQLALNGQFTAAPNPMVGSVIVYQDQIIGEGWHHRAGEAHAEVHAIQSVKNPEYLKQSTLYVSLEPCAHHGRTPPCSDLIIGHQIPRVVIGTRDYYHEVNGKGIEKLKNAGIEVLEGVLENEAQEINQRFFTFHHQKRPYIQLKWAQSKDGFMDPERAAGETGSKAISSPESQTLVHRERAKAQAILVGRKTFEIDQPRLNLRAFLGTEPLKIVLDPKNKLGNNVPKNDRWLHWTMEDRSDENPLPALLQYLYQKRVQSLMVEGGAFTLQSFIDLNLWDEALVIESSSLLKKGLKAPILEKMEKASFKLIQDQIKRYYRL